MLNVCLVGAGRMGRLHARHLAASGAAKLVAVVDPHQEAREPLAASFGAKAYATSQEALQAEQVEAVVIASPTPTHASLIKLWAEAGIPIFCEKPIALDVDRVEECLEVIRSTGVPFLLGFQRRFDPSIQELRRRIREGSVGKVEQLTITSRDRAPPDPEFLKTSGGLFLDFTIHDFDMAAWLLEEEITEVYATGSCLVDPQIGLNDDIDTAMLVLRTERGALCHIFNSRRAVFGYDQRIEVSGAQGMLCLENPLPTALTAFDGDGVHRDALFPNFPERYLDAYQREIHHFLTEVATGAKLPLVDAEAGLMALRLAQAAKESLAQNRTVTLNQLARQ